MCGIFVSTRGFRRGMSLMEGLRHRGPDAQQFTGYRNGIVIGQTRLAIVDTTNPLARQPYTETHSYTISFNGELFNQPQLKEGPCDTEVHILGRLMEKEHDLAQVLNGYYAIAFYDVARNKIVLARDFYGVMPLYYVCKNGHFDAASEPATLLRGNAVTLIDQADIKTVPANSRVTFDLKTRKVSIEQYSNLFRMHGELSVRDYFSAFCNAVKRTAGHTDNGFSVAYSGGLDSSMVLAALRYLDLKPKAIISTYVGDPNGSEQQRAREYVKKLGWDDVFQYVETDSTINVRSRLPEANPIRDFAFQRHATVARHAPTKVILCGEGADELGLGYPLNRNVASPVDRYLRRVSLLRSQATMTLDRVNMAGMMFSKEYRVPFLDLDFSLAMLGSQQIGKSLFRFMAEEMGVPASIVNASKYSDEETIGRARNYDEANEESGEPL